jgi:hypothetical protein
VELIVLCRQVFMPFSLQLRHTKSSRHSGQDLRLQAPEIHALLDSREFLTFVDVVRCDTNSLHLLAFAPTPQCLMPTHDRLQVQAASSPVSQRCPSVRKCLPLRSVAIQCRHVMMPPPPEVVKLNEEATLLGEPEDESVSTGREAFALLYQELASLAAEVHSYDLLTSTPSLHGIYHTL